jgi:LacI family transcriptional regulator
MLRANPGLKGLYISTVNSAPVLKAAEQEGRLAGLTVVTTDLFPELVEWIRAGKVAATVYQRPLTQGRVALQQLYQHLQHRRRPTANQRVVPYLVMRTNLDLVLERLSVDRDGGTAAARRGEARPTAVARPRRPRTA